MSSGGGGDLLGPLANELLCKEGPQCDNGERGSGQGIIHSRCGRVLEAVAHDCTVVEEGVKHLTTKHRDVRPMGPTTATCSHGCRTSFCSSEFTEYKVSKGMIVGPMCH